MFELLEFVLKREMEVVEGLSNLCLLHKDSNDLSFELVASRQIVDRNSPVPSGDPG